MRNRLLFLAVLAGTLGAQAPAPRPVNPNAARALWRPAQLVLNLSGDSIPEATLRSCSRSK